MLPAGFEQHIVTFQADVVEREMDKMHHVMGETVAIVMAVVMLFLGWRTGLIVGAIVPLTILGALVAMRALGVELQTVLIAAIILALGLLVDNGIVIAEDIERRLGIGEDRRTACIAAGRTLALPLLTSSLVIVLAFSPFFWARPAPTNTCGRSRSCWRRRCWARGCSASPSPLAVPVFRAGACGRRIGGAAYDSAFYRGYRRAIESLLAHKPWFVGAMLALLAGAIAVLASIPYDFLPKSDRLQFQMPVNLQPGSDSRQTLRTVQAISQWFADKTANPEVVDSIGYVADGGPRIVLGLAPPLPAAGMAYFTVSVRAGTDIDAVIARTRAHVRAQHPEARAEPKRFSMGSTEAGVAIYRVIGPDETVLRGAAEAIAQALRALPGTEDVYDDWNARIPRYQVRVDPLKARRAGVTSEGIAQALQMRYSGTDVSVIRDDGVNVPIVLRGDAGERAGNGDPGDTLVSAQGGGSPVPLASVATVVSGTEPSAIVRRNLSRAITVTGQNLGLTATEIVSRLAGPVAAMRLPPGYRIELGARSRTRGKPTAPCCSIFPTRWAPSCCCSSGSSTRFASYSS